MSTHAEVFFEREDGTYTGTYVHYDGYPDVCGKGMAEHQYDEIKRAILSAQRQGGMRFMGPGKIELYTEQRRCAIEGLGNSREKYVYVKRRDGSVDMVAGATTGRITFSRLHPPVSGVTPHQLADFLEKNCGWRCLDDEADVMAVVTALLDEFAISRR